MTDEFVISEIPGAGIFSIQCLVCGQARVLGFDDVTVKRSINPEFEIKALFAKWWQRHECVGLFKITQGRCNKVS